MQGIADEITNVFDQLDPFSTGNRILFFAWIVVFAFTSVAVWRCPFAWFRFLCFIVNQLFSVGILISWGLVVVLAVTYWRESLLVLAGTGIGSFWLFRRRRPRVAASGSPDQVRDGRRPAGLPPSRLDADDEPL
jgi:hypothetical protein